MIVLNHCFCISSTNLISAILDDDEFCKQNANFLQVFLTKQNYIENEIVF